MKIKLKATLPLLAMLLLALATPYDTNSVHAVSPSQIFYDDLDEDDAMDSEVAIIKDLSAVVLEGHADPAEQRDAKRAMSPLAVQHIRSVNEYSPDDPDWEKHYQNMKQVEQNLNNQFKMLCLGKQAAYDPSAIKDLSLSTAARHRIAKRMSEALTFAGVVVSGNGQVKGRAKKNEACKHRPFQVTIME